MALLLAAKKLKKPSKKQVKTIAVVAGTGALAIGAWYLLSKNRVELEPAVYREQYEIAPVYTTAADVQSTATETVQQYVDNVAAARDELAKKLELQNQNQTRITELETEIANLENEIAYKNRQINTYNDQISRFDWEIENVFRHNLQIAENTLTASTNARIEAQRKLAQLEFELDAIYDRNEWLNPLWYFEKGNKERQVQEQRSAVAICEANYLSALSARDNAQSALNQKTAERSNVVNQKNQYQSRVIQPLQTQLEAARQTLHTYRIAFDAIAIEIEKLKAITGGV